MRELTFEEIGLVSGAGSEAPREDPNAAYYQMIYTVVGEIGVAAASMIFGAALVAAAIVFCVVLLTPTPAY